MPAKDRLKQAIVASQPAEAPSPAQSYKKNADQRVIAGRHGDKVIVIVRGLESIYFPLLICD